MISKKNTCYRLHFESERQKNALNGFLVRGLYKGVLINDPWKWYFKTFQFFIIPDQDEYMASSQIESEQ